MVFHDKILLRGVIKGGLIFSVGDYALFMIQSNPLSEGERSLVAEQKLPKLLVRVRFPSLAPVFFFFLP